MISYTIWKNICYTNFIVECCWGSPDAYYPSLDGFTGPGLHPEQHGVPESGGKWLVLPIGITFVIQISLWNASRALQMLITLVWMASTGPGHHPEQPDGPESGGNDVSLYCYQLLFMDNCSEMHPWFCRGIQTKS